KFGSGIKIWNLCQSTDASPLIEDNLILNARVGINMFSQAFGGQILGEIRNNTIVNNGCGLLLRMHKENPLIQDNIITDSSDSGIHFTYQDGAFLNARLVKIIGNVFFNNPRHVWCDATQEECTPLPDKITEEQGNSYDIDPEFDPDYIPLNPDCIIGVIGDHVIPSLGDPYIEYTE
ncbi:MAG: right-handed parallel beta-helix repeat-containing protein, partial [Candidatus Omnitrophota bacterium]